MRKKTYVVSERLSSTRLDPGESDGRAEHDRQARPDRGRRACQLRERYHRCPCAAWPVDPASRVVGGSKVGDSFGARVPGNTQFRRPECLCQGGCTAGVQATGGPGAPVCRADPGRGIVSACPDERQGFKESHAMARGTGKILAMLLWSMMMPITCP